MKNTNSRKVQGSGSKSIRKAASNCLPWWDYVEGERRVVMTDNSMTPRAPMHSVLTYAPGAKPKHGDVVVARLKGQTAPFIGYLKIQNRKFVIAPTNPEFKPFSADESRFEAVDPVVGWFTLLTQEGQEKMARRVAEIRLEIASVERGEI